MLRQTRQWFMPRATHAMLPVMQQQRFVHHEVTFLHLISAMHAAKEQRADTMAKFMDPLLKRKNAANLLKILFFISSGKVMIIVIVFICKDV